MAMSEQRAKLASDGKLLFFCPGCDRFHGVQVGDGIPRWDFSGDMERPTLWPSVMVQHVEDITDAQHEEWMREGKALPVPRRVRCHSFVERGRIEFLGDSTHALKGQTVDLPVLKDGINP